MTVAIVVLALVIAVLVAERHVSARATTAERNHLLAIVTAPTPAAAHNAARDGAPRDTTERDKAAQTIVPIGGE